MSEVTLYKEAVLSATRRCSAPQIDPGVLMGFPLLLGSLRSPQRALPTETKVESGTSQSKSGTSVHFRNSGEPPGALALYRTSWTLNHCFRAKRETHSNAFDMKAKAEIWPCLSYICHVRSTAGWGWAHLAKHGVLIIPLSNLEQISITAVNVFGSGRAWRTWRRTEFFLSQWCCAPNPLWIFAKCLHMVRHKEIERKREIERSRERER